MAMPTVAQRLQRLPWAVSSNRLAENKSRILSSSLLKSAAGPVETVVSILFLVLRVTDLSQLANIWPNQSKINVIASYCSDWLIKKSRSKGVSVNGSNG